MSATATKERPILFSGPMVRAILDGRKTQTRRVVKSPAWWKGMTHYATGNVDERSLTRTNMVLTEKTATHWQYCPHGHPGDRLWVREMWRTASWSAEGGWGEIEYAAGGRREVEGSWSFSKAFPSHRSVDCWRPSIHMPRWASRITLEIIGVRVERLKMISGADAISEGMSPTMRNEAPAVERFCDLWQSINGPGSWDANPWVWVIEFKRIGAPV